MNGSLLSIAPDAPPERLHNPPVTDIRKEDVRIMIVDDEVLNIKVVRKHLAVAGYQHFITLTDPTVAVSVAVRERPSVILLDVMMPDVDGLSILAAVRALPDVKHTPVLILTAADDEPTRIRAFELGATDFLGKPIRMSELLPRVRNAVLVKAHYDSLLSHARDLERQVRQRTAELAASRLELIHCLARTAEYRDHETGRHVIRVGKYAGIIARQLGLDSAAIELIEHAAPLHDMGKVGIPDAVLLKPGKLSPEEFEIMQRHAVFGKRTFEPMGGDDWRTFQSHTLLGEMIMGLDGSPLIRMAGTIALTHHEKWDGSGYPLGLAGEDIPLEGRITAVADVFDALSSRRPYKPAMPIDKCFQVMEGERGTHFDPRVLDAFFARREEIVQVLVVLSDTN